MSKESPERKILFSEFVQAGKRLDQVLGIPQDYSPRGSQVRAWAIRNGVWEVFSPRARKCLREADPAELGELIDTILSFRLWGTATGRGGTL